MPVKFNREHARAAARYFGWEQGPDRLWYVEGTDKGGHTLARLVSLHLPELQYQRTWA